jgi:hypothetical protein
MSFRIFPKRALEVAQRRAQNCISTIVPIHAGLDVLFLVLKALDQNRPIREADIGAGRAVRACGSACRAQTQ